MKVTLLSHTPEPERVVATAARLCYSPMGIDEVGAALDGPETTRLVRMLAALGHLSPFEHVTFQFGVEGVSRTLTHQLVRHRIASYSQKSQRYVDEDGFAFVVPPSVAARPAAAARFGEAMSRLRETYADLVAQGVPREDARFVLPNACETKIIVSMNARALLHFFEARCCGRAQWEIRQLAECMLAEARRVAPAIFEKAGPSCVAHGTCREGKMTCGRAGMTPGRAGMTPGRAGRGERAREQGDDPHAGR
jgi:thymidylate synthase (FAD)